MYTTTTLLTLLASLALSTAAPAATATVPSHPAQTTTPVPTQFNIENYTWTHENVDNGQDAVYYHFNATVLPNFVPSPAACYGTVTTTSNLNNCSDPRVKVRVSPNGHDRDNQPWDILLEYVDFVEGVRRRVSSGEREVPVEDETTGGAGFKFVVEVMKVETGY